MRGPVASPSLPVTSPPTGTRWEPEFSTEVVLGGGQEWTSNPLRFAARETIDLRCDAGVRFYAGFFEENEYAEARRKGGATFPFLRGSDRIEYDEVREVEAGSAYRVVLRIGVFAPGGRIRVGVWRAATIAAPALSPSAPITEDMGAENRRARAGKFRFGILAAGVIAIAIWLLGYDFFVIGFSNPGEFYSALNAEASAVFSVSVVLGGLYAAWREWVAPHKR